MLMSCKTELRRLYKSVRKSISDGEKEKYDGMIFTRFVNSDLYKNAGSLLIYVSVGSEADTLGIIGFALADGKRIAVPYCHGNEMRFCVLESLDELTIGAFGIPSVNPDKCSVIDDFSDALCVVPGLSFDLYGNRLGYGGGYYDRF